MTGLTVAITAGLTADAAGLPFAPASVGPPLDPSRDQARQWAVEELSRREYAQAQPGLLDRAAAWAVERLGEAFDALGRVSSPGEALGLGLVAVALVALVGYLTWRFGGPGGLRAAHADDPVFGQDGPLPAADHRWAAEQAALAGDWERAVLEWFRAVVRELEERTVLSPRPGRTAGELSTEVAGTLPDVVVPLARAARVFDEVRYGGRTATEESASTVRAADRAVRSSRVVIP